MIIPMSAAESLSSLLHDLPGTCSRHFLPRTEVFEFWKNVQMGFKVLGAQRSVGVLLPNHQELTPLQSWAKINLEHVDELNP